MRGILLLFVLMGLVFSAGNPFIDESAYSGKFFQCYADCFYPNMTSWLIGCEINATENGTETNLVMMGSKKTRFFSHEYYTNGYREDLWCYYSVPILNVTGTEKEWKYVDTDNGNGNPNITGPTPPIIPGAAGPLNAPGVKGKIKNPPKNKQAKILMKKDDKKPGKPNEKFAPKQVTTPANFKATHYTCTSDCDNLTSKGLHLIRCSIIYNFKGKDNLEQIVQAPFLRTSILDTPFKAHVPGGKINSSKTVKRSKVWTKSEGGKNIYDEVLVCEYVEQAGAISYVEPQTPDQRLGYVEPLGPGDLKDSLENAENSSGEFKHNASSCMANGYVLPYGYANINGTLYEVEDEQLDWAENCVGLEGFDYGLVRFLNTIDESSTIHNLLAFETVQVVAPGFEGCVKFGERVEDAISGESACSEFGAESAMVFISDDAMERLQSEDPAVVVEEEWGTGIVYDAFGISGIAKKLGAEIAILVARLF